MENNLDESPQISGSGRYGEAGTYRIYRRRAAGICSPAIIFTIIKSKYGKKLKL